MKCRGISLGFVELLARTPHSVKPSLMVVAALVLLSVFVTYLLSPKEPTYRGKSLRAWIEDLKEDSRFSASRAQAEEAIRAMGIGALPFLEQMLSAQPGPEERLVDFLRNQYWIEVTHSESPSKSHQQCEYHEWQLNPACFDRFR